MSTKQERINSIVDERRVKLHLFNPSKREIWTVVGKAKEHWIDPISKFCSCSGYYFGMIKNKNPCYHLESIFKAKKENKFEIIEYIDDEYESFITGIVIYSSLISKRSFFETPFQTPIIPSGSHASTAVIC